MAYDLCFSLYMFFKPPRRFFPLWRKPLYAFQSSICSPSSWSCIHHPDLQGEILHILLSNVQPQFQKCCPSVYKNKKQLFAIKLCLKSAVLQSDPKLYVVISNWTHPMCSDTTVLSLYMCFRKWWISSCLCLWLSHPGMHCNSVGLVPICLKLVWLIYVLNGVPSFVDVGLDVSAIYHHGRHYGEVFDQSALKPFSPDVQGQHLVLHLPGTKWELLSLTPSSVRSHLSSSSKSVTTG